MTHIFSRKTESDKSPSNFFYYIANYREFCKRIYPIFYYLYTAFCYFDYLSEHFGNYIIFGYPISERYDDIADVSRNIKYVKAKYI